jgi:hypothetical protein
MGKFWYQLAISFLGSIPALMLALWVERQRMPKLEIIASKEANADNTYLAPHPHAGERWSFFRVLVRNKPFIKPFHWIPRQTAENCSAKIEIFEHDNKQNKFSMLGRWASTLEPAFIHHQDQLVVKLLYPDTVIIPAGKEEYLDVIVKHDHDKEAYGWNNEAYLHDWRTPNYKLDVGMYLVKINITTQNGKSFLQEFELSISERIEDTYLKKDKS